MKKILFPTDLSEAAEKAFIYALQFAEELEADLYTLHVYPKPDLRPGGLSRTLADFYESYDLEQFQNFKDSIPTLREIQQAQGLGHLNVQHLLKSGRTVQSIIETASEEAVDMIIMGTTGARGLKAIFMGSVAGEVLEYAECPVLAVPENARFDGKLDNIAFALSYQEEEIKAFQKVLDLAKPFQANIHCVNVDLAHTSAYTGRMEQFKTQLPAYERTRFEVLDGLDVKEALSKYMDENELDILAMVTHKRNFFQELFRYSRAKDFSYYTDVPVLSIPAHIL